MPFKPVPVGSTKRDERGYVLEKVAAGHPLTSGKRRWVYQHRLVLHDAGVEINGLEVHHRNGVKDDNRRENLEPIEPDKHARREALHTAPRRFKRPTRVTPRASLALLRERPWLAGAYESRSTSALARELGTTETVVRYWLKQHGIPTKGVPARTPDERREAHRLRQRRYQERQRAKSGAA